ncbi:hypothetical protein SAMN05216308_10288 [Nitrosospira sp. Nsp13]|nr:hypothetical protein SAMN05216308_10288 [Nitrosospira sp. Nsp13]
MQTSHFTRVLERSANVCYALNPDNPLGGSASLPECDGQFAAIFAAVFATSAASIDPAMDFSQPAKLPRQHLAS